MGQQATRVPTLTFLFSLWCHTLPQVDWREQQLRGQVRAHPAIGQCTCGLYAQSFLLYYKAKNDFITWTFKLFLVKIYEGFFFIFKYLSFYLHFAFSCFCAIHCKKACSKLIPFLFTDIDKLGKLRLVVPSFICPTWSSGQAIKRTVISCPGSLRNHRSLADKLWNMQCLWWSMLYNHMR